MWQKMVTKLEQGKKFVMELVEQSVAAYDQREDICNKIQNLDDRGQLENNVHMQVSTADMHCDAITITNKLHQFDPALSIYIYINTTI